MAYYSQFGQDFYILKYFNNKNDGFFIEIGAYNGVSFSNTKKMEDIGWDGICVEPNPVMFEKVEKARKCHKYNVALAESDCEKEFVQISGNCAVLSGIREDYHPEHVKRIEDEIQKDGGNIDNIKVRAITFSTLMADFPHIKTIDYISIDTEGNEFKILKTIDFNKYDIKTLSIENNYDDTEIREFMKNAGYRLKTKLGCDDIYVKR